jgi:Family of unknown function (DUF6518)
MSVVRKLTLLLVGAVAFGVLVAVVKGQDTGVRDALGNTSAPWVVLPFIAGTCLSRARSAALVGVAVTLASLLGFYVAEAAVLDLGPHPWWVDLRLTAGSVNIYEKWGIVSGLLYGTFGWLWAYRSKAVAAAAVGVAFAAEPLIVFLASKAGMWHGLLLDYGWMWMAEILFGIAGIALAFAARPPRRSHA